MKSKISSSPIVPNFTVIILVFLFTVLALSAHRFSYFASDLSISRYLQNIHHPLFSLSMNFVSELGDDNNLEVLVVLAISLLFFTGLKSEAIKTALLTIASATAGTVIKSLVSRPRPASELVAIQETLGDMSFPSLHVLIFTVFFGYLFYLSVYKVKTLWLRLMIATSSLVLILTIGISRIYLGAHWASDTLGGYLLGAIFLILAIQLSEKSSNNQG